MEGLLPAPHGDAVQPILFQICNVHALFTLRLHSDTTLKTLEDAIADYGTLMRRFQRETRSELQAKELPSEVGRRVRRQAADAGAGKAPRAISRCRNIPCNLQRYRYHALGDNPASIRLFGTLEGTSSQNVSC